MNGNAKQVHNIQEVETMGKVKRTVPRTYAALGDHQAHHPSTMAEVEGNISKKSIYILIDP